MGKIYNLKEAIKQIWETVKISEEEGEFVYYPYLFIVGAGISVPEILPASGIVHECKEKVKELCEEDDFKAICERAKRLTANSAAYYSFWFEQAYKNKIHRQQYLKKIINDARISTSNLLLAQILNSKKIATTVVTPNFDNQLMKSLNLLGNYNVFSANNMMDNDALISNSKEIQIMHVHGTYEFYDCCNLEHEITKIAQGQGIRSTAGTIEEFLKSQAPIVIGYSGWEDDVIMSKIKERLEYALPYSMIWFCYTKKDYENLPNWLKEADDVIFVLPEEKKEIETQVESMEEISYLPAEDVLTALITKFEFKVPNLFNNPIQYYIELIDAFLPQNIDVFPVKSWKKRLDYIEEHLDDIEKKIIDLERAAAGKDIIAATKILQEIDFTFISVDDLEHIVNVVVLSLLSSKNRIEDASDLLEFLNVVLDLLSRRYIDIKIEELKKYLKQIIGFFANYKKQIEKKELLVIYDKVLLLCGEEKSLDEVRLVILGEKSDIVGEPQKLALQNEIIEYGMQKINNVYVARSVLIAIFRQIEDAQAITEEQKIIINNIIEIHRDNKELLEVYCKKMMGLCEKKISINISIDDIIEQIEKNKLSENLMLHAQYIKCNKIDDEKDKTQMACKAIDEFDFEKIDNCRCCLDYAYLLKYIIIGKINLKENTEPKFINLAIKLLDQEDGCMLISRIIMRSLNKYINNIQSEYERRELCKRIISICDKNEIYMDWAYFNDKYYDCLENSEKQDYLIHNDKYKDYREAYEKVSIAIDNYTFRDVDMCKKLLLEASEIFDKIFEEKYNPALLNICFLARRGEAPELNISVLDVLNKITWMEKDAFLQINKALTYIKENNWVVARKEVSIINIALQEALQWWNQEDVVGKEEKFIVLVLLIIENKIEEDTEIKNIIYSPFWDYCIKNVVIPQDILDELHGITEKYCERVE